MDAGVSGAATEPSIVTFASPEPITPVEASEASLRDLARAARTSGGAQTEILLGRVRQLAVRYARARLRRHGVEDAAQDVAQEVCMAVLTALPTYQERGYPFEAFVYSVTARKVADVQRAILRRGVSVAEVPDGPDEQLGPEALAVVRDDMSHAMSLIDQLPTTQREVLLLRVVMGLSTEETAASLQSSVGAVRVAQHRALASLRRQVTSRERGVAG